MSDLDAWSLNDGIDYGAELSWQAEQFRDECERMRAIVESLEKAEKAGTPRETVIHLADECGVGEFYRKHEPT